MNKWGNLALGKLSGFWKPRPQRNIQVCSHSAWPPVAVAKTCLQSGQQPRGEQSQFSCGCDHIPEKEWLRGLGWGAVCCGEGDVVAGVAWGCGGRSVRLLALRSKGTDGRQQAACRPQSLRPPRQPLPEAVSTSLEYQTSWVRATCWSTDV